MPAHQLHVLVVDDNSPDGTQALVKEFRKGLPGKSEPPASVAARQRLGNFPVELPKPRRAPSHPYP